MKKVIFLLFAFSSCAVFAQESSPEQTSKLRLGISLSGTRCYRIFYADDTAGIGQIYTLINKNEIAGIGYNVGLTASYSLSDHLNVDAGIKYTMHRYRSVDYNFTDVNGTIIGDGYTAFLNRFISLPIGLHYTSAPGKIRFIGGATIIPEYQLGVWTRGNYNLPDTYDLVDTYSKDQTTDYNDLVVSASTEIGCAFTAGKFTTEILPNYKICLMKQANGTPINRRLWSAGLEVRILYSI